MFEFEPIIQNVHLYFTLYFYSTFFLEFEFFFFFAKLQIKLIILSNFLNLLAFYIKKYQVNVLS